MSAASRLRGGSLRGFAAKGGGLEKPPAVTKRRFAFAMSDQRPGLHARFASFREPEASR